MVQWVYEGAARASRLARVIVATDDERIFDAARGFGAEAVMTSAACASGTDRVAEVAARTDADVVINIQGDEPLIEGAMLDPLVEAVEAGAAHGFADDPGNRPGPSRRSQRGQGRRRPRRGGALFLPVGAAGRIVPTISISTSVFTPIAATSCSAGGTCRLRAWSGPSGWSSCGPWTTGLRIRMIETRVADLERRRAGGYNQGRKSPVEADFMSKYIFVTGGVLSGLGKGIAAASIGRLLESHGFKITIQKFDPYLNVDPGTMSPFQHGEVYVTDDGAETDLDLGHYERFTSTRTTKYHNWTAGQDLRARSSARSGAASTWARPSRSFPTSPTRSRTPSRPSPPTTTSSSARSAARSATSRACPSSRPPARCGSTLGAGEHALRPPDPRPLRRHFGRAQDQAHPAHASRSCGPSASSPTSCSAARTGPCRADLKTKIALFTNVPVEAVITARDVENIYEIPLIFAREGLDAIILKKLGLPPRKKNLEQWKALVNRIQQPQGRGRHRPRRQIRRPAATPT